MIGSKSLIVTIRTELFEVLKKEGKQHGRSVPEQIEFLIEQAKQKGSQEPCNFRFQHLKTQKFHNNSEGSDVKDEKNIS